MVMSNHLGNMTGHVAHEKKKNFVLSFQKMCSLWHLKQKELSQIGVVGFWIIKVSQGTLNNSHEPH